MASSSTPSTPPPSPPDNQHDDADDLLDDDLLDDDHCNSILEFAETRTAKPKPASINPSSLQDLVRQHVLPLLPVCSLLRLRSVSHPFKRHISSPIFHNEQSFHNRSLSGLFRCDEFAFQSFLYIPFTPSSAHAIPDPALRFLGTEQVCILAASGGLLCCESRDSPGYIICNPATMSYTSLPPLTTYHVDGVALHAADPHYVLICTFLKDAHREFAVFSSQEGAWLWASPQEFPGGIPELPSPQGIAVGGTSYWRTTTGTIMFYDFVGKRSGIRDVPEGVGSGRAVWQLGEFQGSLCCVSFTVDDGDVTVHAMGMEGWVKVKVIKTLGDDVRPVAIGRFGLEDLVVVVVGNDLMGINLWGDWRLLSAIEIAGSPEFVPYTSTFAFVEKIDNEG